MKSFRRLMFLLVVGVLLFSTDGLFSAKAQNEIDLKSIQIGSIVKGSIKNGIHDAGNSIIIIKSKDTSKWYQTVTNVGGDFSIKLPDGNYEIKAMKSNENAWYTINKNFTIKKGNVKGEHANQIEITKKVKIKEFVNKSDINVFGAISNINKESKAEIVVSKLNSENGEEVSSIPVSNNGEFSASLSDGPYLIFGVSVDKGFYSVEFFFDVEGKDVLVNGEKQSSLSIELPKTQYKGNVHDNSKPFTNVSVDVEKMNGDGDYRFVESVKTDQNGNFKLRELPDGTYSLSVYHETFQGWQYFQFEVANGIIVKDGKQLDNLNISVPDLNLNGTVLEGKKTIGKGDLFVEQLNDNGEFLNACNVFLDKKGAFQYRLRDGKYRVSSLNEDRRVTALSTEFQIENGKLVLGEIKQDSLDINVPSISFNAKLLDKGTTLDGQIHIEKITEEGQTEEFDGLTDTEKNISLRLQDGQYHITYAYLPETDESFPVQNALFEIKDGKLLINGEEKSVMDVTVPPVSFNAVILDGEAPVNGGDVNIVSEEGNSVIWKTLNPDGSLSIRLADGNYKIEYYFDMNGDYTVVNKSFTIHDSKLIDNGAPVEKMVITLPPVTLAGVLLDQGTPVSGVMVVTGNEENSVTYWVRADQYGKFSDRLPDGSYNINEIRLNDGTTDKVQRSFTIQNGKIYVNGEEINSIQIDASPVTLSGSVYNGEDVLSEGQISLLTQDQDFIQGTIFDGTYKFRLSDGEYQLFYVDTNNGPVFFNKPFSIQNGKIIIDGQEQPTLDIQLQDGNLSITAP